MISYLRGRVLTTTAETVILDVNGVGYEAYCSGGAFKKIVQGEIAELYTYLQVKEDGVTLFGFESPKEKELFLRNAVYETMVERSKKSTYSVHDYINAKN